MSDIAAGLACALLLALPGLAGYAFAVWRAHGPRGAWIAWAVPTAGLILFCGGCWLFSRAMERELGYDDGSVGMSLTMLVATCVVNAFTAMGLLAWTRRGKRSARGERPGGRSRSELYPRDLP